MQVFVSGQVANGYYAGMRNIKPVLLVFFLLTPAVIVDAAAAAPLRETRFTIVDGSPGTWVARGLETYEVTEADGWSFSGEVSRQGRNNFVSVIMNGPGLPSAPFVNRWSIGMVAPFDVPLTVGVFEGATRFPFNDRAEPGFEFISTGRGDNRLLADYEVLEVAFDTANRLESLAVNFTYYGEVRLNQPVVAELRFNALVPEPLAASFLAVSGLMLFRRPS